MPHIRYFRDVLTIDPTLISSLNASGGDTLVFGARQVTLLSLSQAFHYVILADELAVVEGAGTYLINTSVTVLAASIDGPLTITCVGGDGEEGSPGEPGESGIIDFDERGRPVMGPGGAGGPGGDGGDGMPGGNITVLYASATETPVGVSRGGKGGRAGAPGASGAGSPRGGRAPRARPGRDGEPGLVDIRQVAPEELWSLLDDDSSREWAAYRAEVAGFLFRRFDYESQLLALHEAGVALILNPADQEAATVHTRIVNRQIPSGLARDLDIAPDFPGLAADLTAEIAVVQNAFQKFVSVVTLETIADTIRDQLIVMRSQLVHRAEEAQLDVAIAHQDVAIAKAERSNVEKEIEDLQKDIDNARDQGFFLGNFISTVGTIAGAVMGISTGVGALISIPAALVALRRVDLELPYLLGELKNAAKDPKHPTDHEYDIAKIKGLGGNLTDLVNGSSSMISFVKVIGDLEEAMSQVDQKEVAKLLRQQAVLVRQKMVASMREKQAAVRVAAAQLRVNNLIADITDIGNRIDQWNAESEFLDAAAEILIRSARRLVDMVMEDVFLAQRAREIYQLEGTPGLRFDFGFLPPDVDRSLRPAPRAATSLTSLADMPIQVLSWIKMFEQLNTAQIGYDVIHPQISLTITEPAQLQAFASGAALSFSIGLADLPGGMFELKANALHLEMTGASSTQSANVWVTHSGEWSMNRRTDGSATTMFLQPRREVFAIRAGSGTLTASIPANPQSNSDSGPPFSFWGRGVATTFRLQIAPPSALDLSQLSAIHVTVDCIGYATQAAGTLLRITPEIQVIASEPMVEASAM